MVLLAFVLFTVSTLAIHTEAFPKVSDQPAIRHECGNETLCHIKPADYPQDEIDRAVLKQLPYLRRMKREILNPVEAAPSKTEGNCQVRKTPVTPFTKSRTFDGKNHNPYYVVQSGLFSQTITQVKCVQKSMKCFSQYLILNTETECKEKAIEIKLAVYDPVTQIIGHENAYVAIDCVCAIKSVNLVDY